MTERKNKNERKVQKDGSKKRRDEEKVKKERNERRSERNKWIKRDIKRGKGNIVN